MEKATGTEQVPMLSAEELEVAKANLRFALENCPVDGGILIEDGGTTSRESVEVLLKRLEAVETRTIEALGLSHEDVEILKALADYGLETCPVEGGMMLDDGRLVSKTDLRALREKIDALPLVVVPK
ncbi:MAG: hypothetical protein ACRD6W_14345 [Nitrososphaerales archaeon]